MPRTQKSPAAVVLSFFASAALETAELVLDLAKAAVADRRLKGAKVRAGRAHTVVAEAVTAATAPAAKVAKASAEKPKRKDTRVGRKRGRKPKSTTVAQIASAGDAPAGASDESLPLEAIGEAEPQGEPDGDLVGAQQ